jgi:outer membrane protein assembly factor BamE (lipoprotein component of BamABCDE complex)
MSRRFLALFLAASLPATTSCLTAEQVAERDRGTVTVGMTKAQVLERLGQPDTQGVEHGKETWRYVREDGEGFLYWSGMVLLYTVLLVFLLLARGGGGGGGGGDSVFRVVFTDEGVVEFVGPVQDGG